MEEIKAGDIMVGNLIYRKYWNPEPSNERYSYSVEKVIGIYKDTIYCTPIVSKQIFKIKDAYPIPLTEDILLKAGATKIGEKLYKFRHAFIVHETSSCFVIRMESEEGRFWNVMPFSYLHQLQNIYRLCMNQDLKVEI